MRLLRRLARVLPVLLVATIVLGTSDPALARKPRPAPCPGGRYRIVSEPLLQGVTAPVVDAVQVGAAIALGDACPPFPPRRLRATRKGVTQLRVKWPACTGFTGKVSLSGQILDQCTVLRGTLKAKRFKRTFEAHLSRCGDGIVDPGNHEECDDGNDVSGDGCEPDCRVTPAPTTTTLSATTTTTTALPTSTTVTTTSTPSSSTGTTGSTTSTTSPTTTTRPSPIRTTTTTTTTTVTTTTSSTSTSTTTTTKPPTTTTTSPTTTTTTTTTTTSSTTTTTAPGAGLGLVMIATPDPVGQGDVLTYDVTVTNKNPIDVATVTVQLPIPSGVGSCQAFSDNGSTPAGCVIGRNVVWSLGTLAAGARRTVQAVFTTNASTTSLPDGTIIHGTVSAADGAADIAMAAADVVVQGTAPLMLGIADDADPVKVGDHVEYTLRFGNVGGAAQLGTSLVVTLPAGMTATATTGGGMIAGNIVTWTLGALNAGDSGQRRLTVSVDGLGASDPLVRVTQAALTSAGASARASEVTTLVGTVPLGLVMIATPDPVAQNGIITYEVTVTNRQAVDAGVQVQMQIPAGVSSCQAFSDSGSAASGCVVGRYVTWNLGTVPSGASRTVSAAYTAGALAADPNGTILHTTASAEDAAGNSAHAAVSSAVTGNASLMLGIADDADPVQVGDHVEYTLRFGNAGGAAQLSTVLTVTLPAGTTATATTGSGVISGNTVTWTLGTLNAGDSGERRVTVSVDDLGAADPLVRLTRAVVQSTAASARANEVTTVAASLGFGLVMIATPDPVGQNGILTYELTVTNRQGVDAAGVAVRTQIPTGVSSCQAISDGGSAPSGCVLGRDVAWSLGTIPAGGSRTVSVVYTASALATDPNGTILHTTGRADDAGGSSARADVSAAVLGNAPLMLGIADDADPVRVGDQLEYTFRFGNVGGAAQLSTVLTVTLPAGTTATATTGSGVISGNTVTWTLGTLNAGDTGERRVTVSVDDLGAADPLVRLTRAVVQSTAASARASEVTTVASSIGLGLVMIATPDPVGQNEVLTYELTVTNRQGVDAAGVAVRTQIPSGVSSCQAISDAGTAPNGCVVGRDVAWSLGTIPAGGSRTVSVVYTAAALATDPNGTILHTTGRADDAGGNSARADGSSAVFGSGPLMLGIADDADPVLAGDSTVYTLRFGNRGGSAQLGTVLTVTLPAGTTPTAAPGGGVISGNTVTWTVGTLNFGDSGERQLTVTVDDLGAADPLVRLTRAVVASTTTSARASEVTSVAASVGLGLVVVATPDPVGRNAVLTYQLTVTNTGPADVADVEVRMQIPTGVAACRSFSDSGTAANGCVLGRDVVWSLGTLTTGANHTVTAAFVTVSSAPPLTNGTIIHATARSDDAGGDAARADTSTAVFQ